MHESPTVPESQTDNERTSPPSRQLWIATLRELLSVDALWFGLIALALALHAESILMPGALPASQPDFASATRWYVFAVLILLIGWWGTCHNVSLLRFRPGRVAWGVWLRDRVISARLAVFGLGLMMNVIAVRLLWQNWYSTTGGWLWALGLVLLVTACLQEPDDGAVATDKQDDATDGSRWRPSIEVMAVVAILVLAVVMRFWKLGDLWPGMHGDEGEAGSSALNILSGAPVSPFMRGWFNQFNVYFWSIALVMKVFGTDLVGLRLFAVGCGLITTCFVYLIAREMFGIRAAILAGALMAFQSADLLFSRMVLTNAAAPTTSVVSYYFLIRGLRTRKHLDFVIAGLAAGFGVYYYAGGRLEGPIGIAFLLYLAILHRAFIRGYWSRLLAFLAALVAMVTPFLANLVAFPLHTTDYPNDRFVWLHYADLTTLYGTSDWKTILWDQLTRCLSLFTWSVDTSANSILNYPPVRPIEAALIVLGLAWAALRWRDTRFGLLSIWFWATVITGGMLTVNQPNLPRLSAALPVLPLVIAAVLDRFAGHVGAAMAKLGGTASWDYAGRWAGSTFAVAAVAVAGLQNWQMYIGYYLNTHQNVNVTAQAIFVQQHGAAYHYYDMGHPILYWIHGDNRFINSGLQAQGEDVVNPAGILPILDNGDKDALFMLWEPMYSYLHVLRAYYPEGLKSTFSIGDAQDRADPIVSYTVSRQAIDAHRRLRTTYLAANGKQISRMEPKLGIGSSGAPAGLRYPLTATWSGAVVAPAYDTYRFRVSGRSVRLSVDGVPMHMKRHGAHADARVSLSQGISSIHLRAILVNKHSRVRVEWAGSGGPAPAIPYTFAPISRLYLWDNHIGRSWTGVTSPIPGQGVNGATTAMGSMEHRTDGFLGFRSTGQAFGPFLSGVQARWTSNLRVRRSGLYQFELNSLEDATLWIDGRPVVNDLSAGSLPNLSIGQIHLTRGEHRLKVQYTWTSGVGYLELFWDPPGAKGFTLMITKDLTPTSPGVGRPGVIAGQ